MTALEIEVSGIYKAATFEVSLKNGRKVKFIAELPESKFFTFDQVSNTLSSDLYFTSKGRENHHIAIKGEDIVEIKILRTKEQGIRDDEKSETKNRIALFVYILIGLIMILLKCHY